MVGSRSRDESPECIDHFSSVVDPVFKARQDLQMGTRVEAHCSN